MKKTTKYLICMVFLTMFLIAFSVLIYWGFGLQYDKVRFIVHLICFPLEILSGLILIVLLLIWTNKRRKRYMEEELTIEIGTKIHFKIVVFVLLLSISFGILMYRDLNFWRNYLSISIFLPLLIISVFMLLTQLVLLIQLILWNICREIIKGFFFLRLDIRDLEIKQ